MDSTLDQTVSVARAEAEKMRTAIAGREQDAIVRMTAGQFAVLSRLITHLCDQLEPSPGALGDTRYWVPLDIFKRARGLALQLQAECEELRISGQPSITLSPASIVPQ